MDEFTLKLSSPITDEQWDAITDVDFDNTNRVSFSTKHGKGVEFIKVVRCKDCKHSKTDGMDDPAIYCKKWDRWEMPSDFYCADGERKGGDE